MPLDKFTEVSDPTEHRLRILRWLAEGQLTEAAQEPNLLVDPLSGAIGVEGSEDAAPPASDTALVLDKWSHRKGAEVLAQSKRLWKLFDLEGLTWKPGQSSALKIENAEREVADFHAAAFEPEPRLAERCQNEQLHQYMGKLLELPNYRTLHASTLLDECASEIAAVALAEQWLALKSKPPEEDQFKQDLAAIQAAHQAVKQAQEEVTDLESFRLSCGIEPGNVTTLPKEGILNLYNSVRGSALLRNICKLAGRYRRLAQSKQRQRTTHGRDEVIGVTLSGDLHAIVQSELTALADPTLQLDAMRRLIERQLLSRDFQALEPAGMGPIVVCVDESSSMLGSRIENAKALALALAWVAHQQNRSCCLVGFASSSHKGNYCPLPPKEWLPQAVLEWLTHSFNGGTSLRVPLQEVPELYESSFSPSWMKKADIIVITDAEVPVPDDMRESFLAWKRTTGTKLISMVLDAPPGDLASVSDRLFTLPVLDVNQEAVGELLSI